MSKSFLIPLSSHLPLKAHCCTYICRNNEGTLVNGKGRRIGEKNKKKEIQDNATEQHSLPSDCAYGIEQSFEL